MASEDLWCHPPGRSLWGVPFLPAIAGDREQGTGGRGQGTGQDRKDDGIWLSFLMGPD
ncbi:hypothetical protein J5X98_07385 [Leptothermofonsia sichuanensis E412]|uniref:hypothetical protein n=1 Tax=Leptothermofonsia sichuanensis TaxID=2917832 RepID=UPI001CA6F31D|nr:hypothetical protein [Leptothermofonsia sichuanensis]QZZ22204.1 hypothetical protein J5X98_07385 [Leptothermofonsia sichuanensis E412]